MEYLRQYWMLQFDNSEPWPGKFNNKSSRLQLCWQRYCKNVQVIGKSKQIDQPFQIYWFLVRILRSTIYAKSCRECIIIFVSNQQNCVHLIVICITAHHMTSEHNQPVSFDVIKRISLHGNSPDRYPFSSACIYNLIKF